MYFRPVNDKTEIVVIGGGAAGFFAAIRAAEAGKQVLLLEKTGKLLTKVLVSGGGRCNVTHDCLYPAQLVKHYPRGGRSLKKSFEAFGPAETIEWFQKRGVALKTESDGRMFPTTDNSETIANCLIDAARNAGVEVQTHSDVRDIRLSDDKSFEIILKSEKRIQCEKLIVTTGGFNKASGYDFIRNLGIDIEPPVPSLFTFNVPDSDLKDLMGISVPNGFVQVPGSKWKEDGSVLITHWGFSAPAVIKLSSRAAIDLHSRNYHFPILINWTGLGEEVVRDELQELRLTNPGKVVFGNPRFQLPARLWERLCSKAGINERVRYSDLTARAQNLLVEMLVRCSYSVRGKTTFKEEFVTCGGVDLKEVDLKTFESKKLPGLYFAGEVLNVDGLTGGFNFQHAWTSGYLAGSSAAQSDH